MMANDGIRCQFGETKNNQSADCVGQKTGLNKNFKLELDFSGWFL